MQAMKGRLEAQATLNISPYVVGALSGLRLYLIALISRRLSLCWISYLNSVKQTTYLINIR